MANCGKVCKKGTGVNGITAGQIKKIKTLQRAIGVDDGVYEFLVKEYSYDRVTSCTGMSYHEAGRLIDHLETIALKMNIKWEKKHSKCDKYKCLDGRDTYMATPKQLRMIEAMWKARSYAATPADKEKMLRHFLGRFGVSDILFLTKGDVRKVKKALDNMPILTAVSAARRRKQYALRVQT
ncbi:MAG: DUF1018 domain-containing protein [Nitrospirae bacterium]|nr:DUF1018 domain-containing protein [Nitrospirota bacterium]